MAITKIQSESLNLADDFAFTGTITGAGESNVPAFHIHRTTNDQSTSNSAFVKVQFNNTSHNFLDTGSYFDASTNYRYTPLVSGKYYFYTQVHSSGGGSNWNYAVLEIRKNGTSLVASYKDEYNSLANSQPMHSAGIIDMNGTTDYVEVYLYLKLGNSGSGTIQGGDKNTYFGGYKLTS